ncbi:MAG: NOP5/NOP56 family protein [Candidatus Nanohaloarchaea archaeon]|nr:NOP5/NOP56 family protein [Candidatus Nanohaloarchaea archaeon]
MELAKTVAGIYVLDGDDVVDSTAFSRDDLPTALEEKHPLEEEYSRVDRTVLSTDRLATIADLEPQEIRDRQRDSARQLAQQELEDAGGRDQLLVQAVRALEDLDEINNELAERLRPWHAQHFPELQDEIDDHAAFADLVAADADRSDINGYDDLAADSTGIPLTGEDAAVLEAFAGHVRDSHALRDRIEGYVEQLAETVVPNLSAVVGPVLAARLVSLAGSVEELAKLPSSTVQVLGAEKAMFRHLDGEGDAPKHGVLFMHEYVRKVPAEEQGKMARVLANKASIAARIDQYDGDFRGDALEEEVRDTFEEITHG